MNYIRHSICLNYYAILKTTTKKKICLKNITKNPKLTSPSSAEIEAHEKLV